MEAGITSTGGRHRGPPGDRRHRPGAGRGPAGGHRPGLAHRSPARNRGPAPRHMQHGDGPARPDAGAGGSIRRLRVRVRIASGCTSGRRAVAADRERRRRRKEWGPWPAIGQVSLHEWLARRPRRRSPESRAVKARGAAAGSGSRSCADPLHPTAPRHRKACRSRHAGAGSAVRRRTRGRQIAAGPVASDVPANGLHPTERTPRPKQALPPRMGHRTRVTDPVDETEPVLAAGETARGRGSAGSRASAPAPANGPGPKSRHRPVSAGAQHAGADDPGRGLGAGREGTGWQIRDRRPGPHPRRVRRHARRHRRPGACLPGGPGVTAELGEKLHWLEANDRPGLRGTHRLRADQPRAAADGSETLQLPADLCRPVVLLPVDAGTGPACDRDPRAPRRAARRALDHLVDEISTILQEH